jgi:predicted nucleotidyltransferase
LQNSVSFAKALAVSRLKAAKHAFFSCCNCKTGVLQLPLYNKNMDLFTEKIGNIKESILKFVPAKYIYLFGSHAYGNPTEERDIDIYVVTPDDIDNFSEIYAKIIGDLGDKRIFFIDLLLGRETVFNARKKENIFEKTICQRGNYYMNNENDVIFSINAVEKVKEIKPIIDLEDEKM